VIKKFKAKVIFKFQRAKRQLQSMLLMNLESRPLLFEDIG